MHNFQICFQGSGKFSELNPEDPAANRELIADLLKQVARGLRFSMIEETLDIEFSYLENLYIIYISLLLFTDVEDIELLVESLVGKAMLQIFSEISFVDDFNV